jgi:hypothetical protein
MQKNVMNSMKLWCNDENKEQKKKYYVKLKKVFATNK